MVLTGVLEFYVYCAIVLKYTKTSFFPSLLELELLSMQLSWIKCIQMFPILQDKYMSQNFLYKNLGVGVEIF